MRAALFFVAVSFVVLTPGLGHGPDAYAAPAGEQEPPEQHLSEPQQDGERYLLAQGADAGPAASRSLEALESFGPVEDREPGRVPVVVVDPGHGGSDTGVVGLLNGLQEKEVALALARTLNELLAEEAGLTTSLTRTEDLDLPASSRASFAQRDRASAFLSIHGGANYSRSASGCSVYYYGEGPEAEQSARLAGHMAEALRSIAGVETSEPLSVRSRVLMKAAAPGVVVEVGRLTNAGDEAALAQTEHRAKLAAAMAAGLKRYLGLPGGDAR